MTTTNETANPMFNRKERDHLAVLEQRLRYLSSDHPERRADPSYIPGEVQALAWALSVVGGTLEPMEVRIERIERRLRVIVSRLGRLEEIDEEDER